jgi:tetratricopeptide (TPR) repeat protein
LWLGAILLLTFAVYLPSLDNDFTNWDDNFYVTDNPLLARPNVHAVLTTPISGNYHPLTIWSLALNHRISGLHPASYHWLSLLLHLANTGLVFLFVWRLSKGRLWTTVATSLFFGIHPMHVESVAWIAERKDVLFAFFYLIGLTAYLGYVDRRRPVWLGVALAASILSVASKPAAVVFPLTLLAIDWYRRRQFTSSVLLEKAPFFAVAIAGGLLTLKAQQMAGAVAYNWGPLQKLLFASYGTVMYVVKLFLPVRLSAIYPYPNIEGQSLGGEFYVSLAAVAILVPAVFYACRRIPAVLFGLAFFFINIVLVLQFVTVGIAVMADRYTYLPYIGLLFALAWWLDERPGAIPGGFPVKPIVAGCLLLMLPVSLVQTWRRCDVWQNSETLWNDTIQKYPRRIVDAYNNRGNYYYGQAGRPEDALADFDQAIALNPRVAKVWISKGNVLAMLNRNDSAFVCFERALQLQPKSAEALTNRGAVKIRRGDLAGAIEDFTAAIALNGSLRDAYTNRALAYSILREHERAITDLRRGIELGPTNPNNSAYLVAIGEALQGLNRHREAVGEYEAAIRMTPPGDSRLGGYYLHRSYARRALGDRSGALGDAQEAVRLGATVDPAYLAQLGG